MKWIKVAIGALIAILSIGIISTSVYKMIQSSEVMKKEISFEIVYNETTYPISIYDEILEYGVIDEYGMVINIVSGYVDNYEINDISMEKDDIGIKFSGYITSPDDDINIDYHLLLNGFLVNSTDITYDVNIKLVFEVPQPPKLTGSSAILILLIPTVFAGGVLLYFYKLFKKE